MKIPTIVITTMTLLFSCFSFSNNILHKFALEKIDKYKQECIKEL